MRPSATVLAGAFAAWLLGARPALAGMPVVTLSDLSRARFQTVSFFLLVLLLCAWGVRAIWNALAADVPRLPRLPFCKAVGVMTLWGLLFVLVLTMISGARELMTPGAWKKQGSTYKLADDPSKPETPTASVPDPDADRRAALDRLRLALWVYARSHDGRFPPDDAAPEIEAGAWQVPGHSGMRYLYVPGRTVGAGGEIVAYEPGISGSVRYVLTADGRIEGRTVDEIRRALEPTTPPGGEKP